MTTRKVILSSSVALATLMMCASAKTPSSPTLMNVGGKDVTLSEFEYLYHKNNTQQQTPQSIDEYLKMFVDYKLKVAEAEAEGLDKTEQFRSEFDGYCRDLARPYLVDEAVADSIYRAQWQRSLENVDVSHIMLPLGEDAAKSAEYAARIDSIRTAVINGADFESLARRFSIDQSVSQNGGRMGWMVAGRLPYAFEEAAWATPVGELSPVVKTPYGLHIIRVNGRRPDVGQVHARHIIKVTRNLSPEQAAVKKAQTDSIYNLLQGGADFAKLAEAESEDGSARRGGDLGFFGAGQMVPEFEQIVFALKDGEYSQPFSTRFGYHIVQRLESKSGEDYETALPGIKQYVEQDERSQLPVKACTRRLVRKFNVKTIDKAERALRDRIKAAGGIDSAMYVLLENDNTPIIVAGKTKVPVSKVFGNYMYSSQPTVEGSLSDLDRLIQRTIDNTAQELERDDLAVNNADYRNLLNEYRDGILLFEISDRNVWSKAKEDKEGLENYFRANRDKYRWDKPKFKSYVIFATSDSIADAAREYLASNTVADAELVTTLRSLYGKDIKVERVIAAQGDNQITDYLAFGGEKPEGKGRWTAYFAYKGRVIDQPEEAADERGAVTSAYQAELERRWLEHLHKTYPVKINEKVLKQAK